MGKTSSKDQTMSRGVEKFMQFRTQRLQKLPLDLLATTPMVQQEGHSEEKTIEKSGEKEKTPKRRRLLKKRRV